MHRISICLLAAVISGCGGSASSSAPYTPPLSLSIGWTGVTHSSGALGGREPIEIGVQGATGTIQKGDNAATLAQLVVSITPQSAGPASFKIADPTIAGFKTLGTSLYVQSTGKAGTTMLTVSIPKGLTATLPILVYPRVAFACAPSSFSQPPQSAPGYAFDTGQPVAVDKLSAADASLVGPGCPGLFHTPSPFINIVRQIARIGTGFPISRVPSGQPTGSASWPFRIFEPQGTTTGFVFATPAGRDVKFQVTAYCEGSKPANCGPYEYIEGLYLVSDSNGKWAY
jgi:hypothetical protein